MKFIHTFIFYISLRVIFTVKDGFNINGSGILENCKLKNKFYYHKKEVSTNNF